MRFLGSVDLSCSLVVESLLSDYDHTIDIDFKHMQATK